MFLFVEDGTFYNEMARDNNDFVILVPRTACPSLPVRPRNEEMVAFIKGKFKTAVKFWPKVNPKWNPKVSLRKTPLKIRLKPVFKFPERFRQVSEGSTSDSTSRHVPVCLSTFLSSLSCCSGAGLHKLSFILKYRKSSN